MHSISAVRRIASRRTKCPDSASSSNVVSDFCTFKAQHYYWYYYYCYYYYYYYYYYCWNPNGFAACPAAVPVAVAAALVVAALAMAASSLMLDMMRYGGFTVF